VAISLTVLFNVLFRQQKCSSLGISLLLALCSTVCLCPEGCRCYGTSRLGVDCNCSWATLQTIPQEGVDANTTVLTASHNKLTGLKNSSFSAFRLQPLAVIALDYNFISDVDSKSFNGLVSLKQLSMSHNTIVCLHPATFAAVTQLQQIQISDNNLTYIHPDLLMKNRHLQLFHVGNNRIRILPSYLFKHNINLEEVHVNDNELMFLSRKQFKHNPKLRIVHLENNNMMYLQVDMLSYSALPLYVNLNKNEIYKIGDNEFRKDCHMRILDLSKNKMEKMSLCQLLCFKESVNIDISGNPLVCGTHLEEVPESCHNYSIRNGGECISGEPRKLNTTFRGRRLYRAIPGNNTFSLSSSIATSNYSQTSADSPTGEVRVTLPQETKQNDISVVSGNESATVAFVNEYGMVSASPPQRIERNISTEVTLVEYDSPMVFRESTMRGILLIAIECLVASVIFLRKLLCLRDANDSAVVDTIELLPNSGPNSEDSSHIENNDVAISCGQDGESERSNDIATVEILRR
jgi:hypothetical protein